MKQPETDILVFVDTDRRESQLLEFESQRSFWRRVENWNPDLFCLLHINIAVDQSKSVFLSIKKLLFSWKCSNLYIFYILMLVL